MAGLSQTAVRGWLLSLTLDRPDSGVPSILPVLLPHRALRLHTAQEGKGSQ